MDLHTLIAESPRRDRVACFGDELVNLAVFESGRAGIYYQSRTSPCDSKAFMAA
jgi:hypothetical protein